MGPIGEAIKQELKWTMRWHQEKLEAERLEREQQLPPATPTSGSSHPASGFSRRSEHSRSRSKLEGVGALAVRGGGSGSSNPFAMKGPVITTLTWRARGQCGPRY
mmetsp:Transcript_20737/g.62455  ORF Transcript_20737/g.62455 Transcript_20737/m.62455 type:complete len:105 (-) Transcript_20737:575-889(-)